MNFKDRWENDADGKRFLFTVEMQRKLSAAGLPIEPEQLANLQQAPKSQPQMASPTSSASSSPSSPPPPSKPAPSKSKQEIEGPASIQIDPMTGKYIGRIKWYNVRKGYGFILRGANEEIFFHRSSSMNDPQELKEAQWILYDVEETKKGPEATDVEGYDGELID
ncbi:MAG: cold shock domain-containing protein [Anaerolineales bacterium]|nr:cold shock domain-containing protein [Anaerolineales bacterium]